jgi:antibiotic biosynthesis monooxygenase (ABM) superfamily enzyme
MELQQQPSEEQQTTTTIHDDDAPISSATADEDIPAILASLTPSRLPIVEPHQQQQYSREQQQQQYNNNKPSSWRRLSLSSLRNITSNCPHDAQQPLTVFAKLVIQPNYEQDFEQWYHDIARIQRDNWPGYLSSELLKPIAHSNEYISIFRYDSYEHLEAWMTSSQRHEMISRAKAFSQAPPLLTFHSLEYWFVPPTTSAPPVIAVNGSGGGGDESLLDEIMSTEPSQQQQQPRLLPPPKYKMVVITFLVIWAMNQWTGKVIVLVVGKGTLPKPALQACTTFLTVLVTAYVALPVATAVSGFWLFPYQPYQTSLRNGFMSLPWPVPRILREVDRMISSWSSSMSTAVKQQESPQVASSTTTMNTSTDIRRENEQTKENINTNNDGNKDDDAANEGVAISIMTEVDNDDQR